MGRRFEDIPGTFWGIIYFGAVSTVVVSVILYKVLVRLTGWKYSFEQSWWFVPSIIFVSLAIAVVGWYLITGSN